MQGSSTTTTPCLVDLPPGCLSRIAQFVLRGKECHIAEPVPVTPGSHAASSAVTLARTHPALRKAAAAAVSAVDFRGDQGAWPAIRALGSTCWPSLGEVRVVVDRSRLVGFLKWLVGASGLHILELRVVGGKYPKEGLAELEKMLLGRLFMQTGLSLVELCVEGVDTKALVMSAVCRCSQLERVSVKHYDANAGGLAEVGEESSVGATEPTLVWYIFLLLCLVNRETLKVVEHPFRDVQMPDGKTLLSALDATWGTLWGNYRAGAKEAAANLPEGAEEMKQLFQLVSKQMDEIERRMTKVLLDLRKDKFSTSSERDPTVQELFKRIVSTDVQLRSS